MACKIVNFVVISVLYPTKSCFFSIELNPSGPAELL
jgi:hypothetical protein